MAPFPFLPMMAIMASLISAMVVQMSVFVYAGFMVEYLDVVDNKDKAGYYAGALSAAFMIGRVCSSHFWGMVADRCGRRFVLVFGILSTMVLSVAFGCSTTFTMAFVTRFLLGLLNAVTVVSRTLVSEVCREEHQSMGMGFVASAWTIGGILGPGVGGLLVEPAQHHPQIFSEHGIFGRHPYLLPNLVGAGLALIALPLVLVYIKDPPSAASDNPTGLAWSSSWCYLGRSNGRDDNYDDGNNGDDDDDHHVEEDHSPAAKAVSVLMTNAYCGDRDTSRMQSQSSEITPITTRMTGEGQGTDGLGRETNGNTRESLLSRGHVLVVLFINIVFAFTYAGFDEVYPLWALSSAAKGGLDWPSPQIGKVFFSCGLMVLVFEALVAVPYLTPWLGVGTSQRMASICEIPVYFFIPLISLIDGDGPLVFVLSVFLLFTCYACSNSFSIAIYLAINNAAESGRRAELNGLAVTTESIARAISPMVFSALFAFSIDGDHAYPFDYHFVFYLLATTRLVAACAGWNRITDNGNIE